MLIYSEPVFRPPAEAGSLIIQLTEGCPWNRCLFCPMYKGKEFKMKGAAELADHLGQLAAAYGQAYRRAFLADGDSLALSAEELEAAMISARHFFPGLNRFGIYGSVFSLAAKSVSDLERLRRQGLRFVYLGLESGSEAVLTRVDKYMPADEMIDNCRRVTAAGLSLSLMVIVGLGGLDMSAVHARETAAVVSAIAPPHTSLLNLMLEHTSLKKDPNHRSFNLSDYCREVWAFLKALECRTIFRANHASNPLALEGVMPRDRERLLAQLLRIMPDML